MRRRVNRLAYLLILHVMLLQSCHKKNDTTPEKAYPVAIVQVIKQDVPFFIEAIGSLIASKEVDIRAQVSGILLEINFIDGSFVKEGTLLFKIDPRSFQNQLTISQADLKQNEAKLAYAKEFAQTYGNLVGGHYVSRLDFLQGIQNLQVLEATVESNKASIENARINLGYTEIYAPISGYLGLHQFDVGNYIQENGTTTLVSLRKVSPLKVYFSIPSYWVEKVRMMQRKHPLCIECLLSEDSKPMYGQLAFIDNTVDQNAGMIVLEGMLPNEDERGWPGQYVTVKLHLKDLPNSLIIPNIALQIGPDNYFVYVLKEDMTVEMRTVNPGPAFNEYRIINSGLSVGEKVVTDGQLNLSQGAKVYLSDMSIQKIPQANEEE